MSWTPSTDFRKIVEDCNAQSDYLTEWENNFLRSIDEQMDRNGGRLTEKQQEVLEKIYCKLP